ncbi:hypothetical protein E1A91_D08G221600v1 [Gossypium mustelinum]|uniref:Uncharacterized protein n=5 Tax=Gossypium TaxID=3633 RepID=A0A0D2N1N5_GOSRA|nr:hypothetical protein ES319_D08G219300v1 [Gossypium barbadense]KJB25867.1 hypothetical protein B456_004G211900 [Gossypium raimondii]TYG58541.1 hypothetical protein ES288_D08G231200v1 [Gossypium darwinii]TYH59533.1 hypothetical protein ES332_D08G228600v1 [Gossypium tomentosum]TYI70436.1 hypothetical protein E1A91_D08G221600v1 [Gossypium mustelinum]
MEISNELQYIYLLLPVLTHTCHHFERSDQNDEYMLGGVEQVKSRPGPPDPVPLLSLEWWGLSIGFQAVGNYLEVVCGAGKRDQRQID